MSEQVVSIVRPRSAIVRPRGRRQAGPMERAALVGLIFGVVGVHLSAVGVMEMLDRRAVIVDVLSLAQATLITLAMAAGAMAAGAMAARTGGDGRDAASRGGLAGLAVGAVMAALLLIVEAVGTRTIFIALNAKLVALLSSGLAVPAGAALLVGGGLLGGLVGAGLRRCPAGLRRIVLGGLIATLVFGVFQELIQLILQNGGDATNAVDDLLYTWEGLTPQGAAITFVAGALLAAFYTLWQRASARRVRTPRQMRRGKTLRAAILLAIVAAFPLIAGSYIGQVLMLVGLYILMGMGLNLEIGLAGLLDLGFVAFFAVGAYTTALLTADSPHALMHLNWWEAAPIAVFASVCVGVLFGVPVLGVRGDYLAVATMGLGEIVRVLVLSDFASPLLAGAQGILQIPRPSIGGYALTTPVQLFYLTLAASAVAAYVAWRLENSRLGRAWTALRDDEDVAQALGVNLIRSKLLAYGLGAAFAGLGGAIFATMLGSVYPSSFQLLISINVLALIIVGGMGSLPGVVVGSLALIGLPELLREFGDYRYLFYGAVLVIMMRLRPEGLWPSAVRQRELHANDRTEALDEGADLLPAASGVEAAE